MKNQMKKIILTLSICLSLLANAQNEKRYDTIRYARDYYQHRLNIFKQEPIEKGGIIFLGNSIAQFGNWKKLLGDSSALNRGIGGDNTFGVLDRLNDIMARQPHKFFLEVGINDISQDIPVNIIVDNILTIVKKVKEKSPATEVYVVSILPTNDRVKNEYPAAYNKNKQVKMVNADVRKRARATGFTYVDLNKVFSDTNGKLIEQYAEPDGLHLNTKGYAVWVAVLKKNKYL
jgi:lysophospholipase L1-like esterase